MTGVDGMPPLSNAGNVLRPHTAVKLSLRLPPTLDGEAAGKLLQDVLLKSPPNGATGGVLAGEVVQRLECAGHVALAGARHRPCFASDFFGKPAMYMGEGGTIPFMGMLGEKFPGAQFMITGVLGPHSNAHGPNEFLHIPMGKGVTACVARVIAEHNAASLRGETTGVAAVAGGQVHGDHGCC
jgi:acetylornithine deacetylase/succinyl-diaminopimelate desuccinylase-like protein